MCIIKHGSLSNIDEALRITNEKFGNNVIFNRCERTGKRFIVTLRVISSDGPGARRGFTGRKMTAACWHVYGTFFDALLSVNPAIEIKTTGRINPVTINDHEWQDRNIGLLYHPLMYSNACKCEGF